jgi:hypothetical protein
LPSIYLFFSEVFVCSVFLFILLRGHFMFLIIIFYQMSFFQFFSQSVACLLILLTPSSIEQKF